MKFFVLSLILALSTSAFAQVVNIEKKRMDTAKSVQGSIDFSIGLVKNNSQILQAENSIKLQYFKGKNLFLFFNEVGLVTVDEQSYLNDGFAHIRFNRELPTKWLQFETFTQYQYNGAQDLNSRYLAGVGPRTRIVDSAKLRCYIGTLGMFEYEERKNSSATSKIRLSSYLSFSAKIAKYVSLGVVCYYQPNINNFEDYRISGEASLKIDLTNNFLIKIIYQHNFDAEAPEGIETLNYSLKNSLGWKF